jgi:MFS transporter, PPP family, 3-phenylpropionic acid transporter
VPPRSSRVVSLAIRARLTYLALYAAVGSATPYLPLYYRHIGLDLGAIGLVVATGSLASMVAGPVWGLLSDRRSGAPSIFLGAALCGLAGDAVLWLAGSAGVEATGGAAVDAAARALPLVLVGVALLAGGLAGISPMLDARALELAGPERSGFGPQRAWGSLSFVIVAFGTGTAVDALGIQVALAFFAASLLATGLLGFSLGPSRRAHIGLVPAAGGDGATTIEAPGASASGRLRAAVRALTTPALGVFLVGAYLTFTTLAGINAFMSLRYAELGAPAVIIGSSWAVGAAVEIPVMLRFPWLAARIGAERLVVAGVLVFALRALGAALTNDPGVLVALTAFGGIGFACFVVGGVTYVSRHAPARLAATAQSLFSGVSNNLGQVTAGVAGGRLADSIGLTGLFGTSAVLGVVAAVVVALAVRLGLQPRAGATSDLSRSIVSSS